MTCIELDWFERLRDGPVSTTALAADAGLDAEAADRLVLAASALQLLEQRPDNTVALGPLGAAMIGDQGIAAMATHHNLFYGDMDQPLALLRGQEQTGLGDYWGYAKTTDPKTLSSDRVAAYSELMAASQPMIAEQVMAATSFSRYKHILDIGGGTGAFLREVGRAYPDLKRTLFDLPGVISNAPADSSIERIGGSFLDDVFPTDPDLLSLVRIIHDHDDHTVIALLKNIRRHIRPDATLMIAEPLAATPGAETVGHVYFGFYLLAMGSGRARTAEEINALLAETGFSPVYSCRTPVPLICSVLLTNPI